MKTPKNPCPDCPSPHPLSRRDFLKQSAATTAAVTAGSIIPVVAEAAKNTGQSETVVKSLYDSLSDKQRETICFPFDHALRSRVDNNWNITESSVRSFDKDQQAMIKEIFMGIHSPEYADTVYNQVEHDSGRQGFEGGSSIAIFGEPGTGKFQFVLTGRHCTRRCDGDSVEGTAFGGPIFYGHAADSFNETKDHPNNAYWYQALRANEVFEALDGKQREYALLQRGRPERGNQTIELTGKKKGLDGIPVSEMSSDQQDLVKSVLNDLLAPFRETERKESMKYIHENGFENLHMAFYRRGDIGNDRVWDVWQLEGPSMVWYFRGAPHVHAWAHIRSKADDDPFAA
ncbi:MAG: DUF3500 domain-containing protein [Verrucomicrobiota bacterium]